MPIEFRCHGCAKLLRTPDESAGKKAKCPQCGAIVDVPPGGATADDVWQRQGRPPTGQVERDAFAGAARDAQSAAEPVNPYAAPAADTTFLPEWTAQPGELSHARIEFDDTLQQAWALFTQNMGPLAMLGLLILVINVGKFTFDYMGTLAVQVAGEPQLIVAFQIVSGIIGFLLQTWISAGLALFVTKMLRRRQATLNDFLAVGPYFLRALGLNLVIVFIFWILLAVCMLPLYATMRLRDPPLSIAAGVGGLLVFIPLMVFIGLRFALCMYFLVDRQAGVFESLWLSGRYMNGNKGTTFLLFLLATVLTTGVCCGTCGIGQILYVPYWGILGAVIYFTATGQAFDKPTVARVEKVANA